MGTQDATEKTGAGLTDEDRATADEILRAVSPTLAPLIAAHGLLMKSMYGPTRREPKWHRHVCPMCSAISECNCVSQQDRIAIVGDCCIGTTPTWVVRAYDEGPTADMANAAVTP